MTDGTNPVIESDDLRKAADGLEHVAAALREVHALSRDDVADARYDADMLGQIAAVERGANLLRAQVTRAAPPANPVIVERVARALYAHGPFGEWGKWEDASDSIKQGWLDQAQAALEAMPDVVGLREALEKVRAALENEYASAKKMEEADPACGYRERYADGVCDAMNAVTPIISAALAKVSGVSE